MVQLGSSPQAGGKDEGRTGGEGEYKQLALDSNGRSSSKTGKQERSLTWALIPELLLTMYFFLLLSILTRYQPVDCDITGSRPPLWSKDPCGLALKLSSSAVLLALVPARYYFFFSLFRGVAISEVAPAILSAV